ncbi:MAG: hypothetical protein QM744_17415 [Mesorhizobium sp.]
MFDKTVGWQNNDTLEGYQQRVRVSAARLGAPCDKETEIVNRLAQTMNWTVRKDDSKLRVGSPISLEWSGNSLEERIPVWLIVHSAQPIRFDGKGYFALGPDSANPFGIEAGKGETRALVSLAARGAGKAGTITFKPLQAGPLDLKVSIVAYLRACQRELVVKQEAEQVDVMPGLAQIVLNTPEGRAAYTHSVEVPRFSRRILLNDTRFLVTDIETQTEIVERAGTDFEISPTHRFVAVNQNGNTEIVDLIDGRTVAVSETGGVRWALGDSVIFTTRAPWAEVDIHSTFGANLRVGDQMTGPACCAADPGDTRVSVDIENATYSIWGIFGYRVGSLQNDQYASISNGQGGYSSEGGESLPLHMHTFWSLGTVSPINVLRMFDVAGGFIDVDSNADGAEDWSRRIMRRLANVGLNITAIAKQSPDSEDVSVVGMDRLKGHFAEQLLRLGITIAPMENGEQLVAAPPMGPDYPGHALAMQTRMDLSAKAFQRFEAEAKRSGWRIKWALPEDDQGAIGDCDHVLMEQKPRPGNIYAPRDVIEIATVGTKGGGIWVARADCTAGATMGSLRPYAAFYVIDFASKAQPTIPTMVEGSFFFENRTHRRWYEHPFAIKADASHLLAFAPGNGVIFVRERESGRTVWIGEGLPNGDLIIDAWLTQDGRHAVQLNADGGFYIYISSRCWSYTCSCRSHRG